MLLNEKLYAEKGRQFAERVTREAGNNPEDPGAGTRQIQKDIRERCAEPPQPAEPAIVGNYGMLA